MTKATLNTAWLAAFVLLVGLAQAAQAKEHKFTLVNKSGRTFIKVTLWPDKEFTEPAGLPNMLNEPLESGKSVTIVFDDDAKSVRWGLSVICEDGHQEGYAKMHLTDIRKLTLKKNGEAMDAVTD